MFHDMMGEPSLFVLAAIVAAAVSGLPGLLFRHGPLGQRVGTTGAILSALLALPALVYMLLTGSTARYLLEWNLPFGACEIALDPLSLFFLIPIFLVFPAGALYACGYWPASSHRSSEPPVTFFYGLLAAAMACVVVARNGALFMISWEVMALAGYFLLVTEHEEEEVRKAGAVYLIASHIGAASLLVLFSQLRLATGSFLFPATFSLHLAAGAATVIFLTALLGFGSKAGIMPLHIWLPSAHANAPSHVSAILSGVMLKMGVYGLLRVVSFFPERPLWWGALLTCAGLASALMGIGIASAQKDIKRLLAYSSIENLGIVVAGIGCALVGQTTGNPRLAYLGLAGGLFHVLNHGLFKPLLFFSAGSVMHATGTREMDRMGGLGARMPWSTALSLCGAVAICGLPPFNGFVSEFLLYLGFFGEARSPEPYLALGAPVLALVGGVAVVSLVKLFGITFLGSPRSYQAAHSHESPASMLLPMALMALLSLSAGIFPQFFLSLVGPVLPEVAPASHAYPGLPIRPLWFTTIGAVLLVLGTLLFLYLRRRQSLLPAATGPTWGCGYLRPTPRMQYTSSSFGLFFGSIAAPMIRTRIRRSGPLLGVAPATGRLAYLPEETLLYRIIMPVFSVVGMGFSYLRRLQHGEVQIYMLYIFATLFVLMLWVR
ncbi:proton-conducting transporter membrane subunit [Geomonas sp.]|uniref:proton-conducting transporter transmembrane domain-containing protein n=1 Tax=Geomonas sp. TaxID=2651584 RepID=UPI002B47FFC6|nr:proton-conducting transporter membrane subunit [Geomonas sp.]HJV34474.1 proton-conducting transporter membrane subunit [Geomonas sp.]